MGSGDLFVSVFANLTSEAWESSLKNGKDSFKQCRVFGDFFFFYIFAPILVVNSLVNRFSCTHGVVSVAEQNTAL